MIYQVVADKYAPTETVVFQTADEGNARIAYEMLVTKKMDETVTMQRVQDGRVIVMLFTDLMFPITD